MEPIDVRQCAGSNRPMNPCHPIEPTSQLFQTMPSTGVGPCSGGMTPKMQPRESQQSQQAGMSLISYKPSPSYRNTFDGNVAGHFNNRTKSRISMTGTSNDLRMPLMDSTQSIKSPLNKPELNSTKTQNPSFVSLFMISLKFYTY